MNTVLILGAVSDLAQATAQKYAAEGWNLILADVEVADLQRIAREIDRAMPVTVHAVMVDAAEFESHAAFLHALPVLPDEAVCVIGYLGDQLEARSRFEEVRRAVDSNLLGVISLLNLLAGTFEARGRGSIAVLSSVAGERGRQGNYIYGSTKGALTAYLSGLRNRLAKTGVHVMTVLPGFCRTSKVEPLEIPSRLMAEPEQLAEAVYTGLRRKKNVIYVLPVWRWIMLLVRHLPERIFQRLAYSRFHY